MRLRSKSETVEARGAVGGSKPEAEAGESHPGGRRRAIVETQARRAREAERSSKDKPKKNFLKFLESSLCREGNECAYLVQISQPKLFNSAELICSHGGECLKVRADLMHLVWCSALLALLGDTSFPNDARIFSSNSRQFGYSPPTSVCIPFVPS